MARPDPGTPRRPRTTRILNSPRPARQGTAIDLALQGGGSHGAFTWGVLDRLLEDGRFVIDGVSGTSAGALNAGVMATGFARGGADGARAALRAFWLDVAGGGSSFGSFAALEAQTPWGPSGPFSVDANPFLSLFASWLKQFSPYQFNPLDINPLRDITRRHVDKNAMRDGPMKLFISATAVSTGQPEVFMGQRLSVDALLASACLPQIFKAVHIDGVAYWDGGYGGNPAIWPLIYHTDATDVVLVKINPLRREALPDTAAEIADRVNEITFNAGLAAEMRAIHFVRRLLREERIDKAQYKSLRLHMVADEGALAALPQSSKLQTDRGFLLKLHGLGQAAAQRWLDGDGKQVGFESTLDIERTFLAPRRVE
jgi:NTE family protein